MAALAAASSVDLTKGRAFVLLLQASGTGVSLRRAAASANGEADGRQGVLPAPRCRARPAKPQARSRAVVGGARPAPDGARGLAGRVAPVRLTVLGSMASFRADL